MLSLEELLQAGITAIKEGHCVEGIELLENFFRENQQPLSKDILQAKMWLVKAYEKEGVLGKALEICEEMKGIPHPQIQTWLDKTLPKLVAKEGKLHPPKTPENHVPFAGLPVIPEPVRGTPQALFHQAKIELKRCYYLQAVQSLETYLHIESDRDSLHYQQAQMTLVKLYRRLEQWDKARKLCERLTEDPVEPLQSWAQQILPTLHYKPARPHRCVPQEISLELLKISLETPPSDFSQQLQSQGGHN